MNKWKYQQQQQNNKKKKKEQKKNKKKNKIKNGKKETKKWMISKEDAHVNNELFKKFLRLKHLVLCIKFCTKQMIKKKMN